MFIARCLQGALPILVNGVSWGSAPLISPGSIFQMISFSLQKIMMSRKLLMRLPCFGALCKQGTRSVKLWVMASFFLLYGVQVARAEEVLKIFSWDTYIAPEVIKEFESSRGVTVDYRTFTNANELRSALESGEKFDLVFPTDHQLRDFIDSGLIAALDVSLLTNRSNIDPYLLSMLASSGADRYVTPYMWGVVGLMVNQPLAEKEYGAPLPNSWSLIFDPKVAEMLTKCGVSMLNAEQEAVSLKMTYKGLRLGDSGARRIRREVAGLLNPGVRLSPTDYNHYHEQMANGEVCVAMTWDLLVPRETEENGLRFSIPEEGGLIFIDSMAIPKSAINPKLAYAFMNFLLEPSNIARNARLSHAIPAIREPLLPDDGVTLRRGFSREERRRLYLLDSLSEKQRKLLRDAWQALSMEKSFQ